MICIRIVIFSQKMYYWTELVNNENLTCEKKCVIFPPKNVLYILKIENIQKNIAVSTESTSRFFQVIFLFLLQICFEWTYFGGEKQQKKSLFTKMDNFAKCGVAVRIYWVRCSKVYIYIFLKNPTHAFYIKKLFDSFVI